MGDEKQTKTETEMTLVNVFGVKTLITEMTHIQKRREKKRREER